MRISDWSSDVCSSDLYACRMSHRLARIVSILGHPLVSLPVAALLLTANQGAGPARLSALVLGLGAIALGVLGYSRWQVRRQRWRHRSEERRVGKERVRTLIYRGAR